MKHKHILITSMIIISLLGFFLLYYFLHQTSQPVNDFIEFKPLQFPDEKDYSDAKNIFYVSPSGNDSNDGLSENNPFLSIQKAVDLAQPGTVIRLAEGTYNQDIISKRNGTEKNPIIITGFPSSVLKGNGNTRVIEINHSYITLENFTVDGLVGDAKKKSGYRDKLIYAQGMEEKNGTTGLRILKMKIQNAGGECIRLRYFAQKNEIADNSIKNCGAYNFILDKKGKNGEGIYIGTAPEQTDDGKNPTDGVDRSDGNWIHGNMIDTQGNECVDIKEGSSRNLVENNTCTGQKDEDSGGLDSRGNENIFRKNLVYGNIGAGIRLGGDDDDDGIRNDVYSNTIRDNEGGGIKILREPQGKICGNKMENNESGDFVGEYGENMDSVKCD